MTSLRRVAVSVSCIAAICGAATTWHLYRAKASELKLAEDARICHARAEEGDATAQSKLGSMYDHGQGVPQDYAEALRWYRKAADQGFAEGQFRVGSLYYHGHGVPQDYVEALRWYNKAADLGYPKAQETLGFMYYQGTAVPQDNAEALRFYRKAADQGYAKAQYNLGYMYFNGRGVPQDHSEAVRWYCKAANQGDEYALRALGVDLTAFWKFALLVQFFGSIWVASDFLSLKSRLSGRIFPDFRRGAIIGTGVIGVLATGLSFYGYTHYKIRSFHCSFDAFNVLRWLLNAVWIALLVYIMRSSRNVEQNKEITQAQHDVR